MTNPTPTSGTADLPEALRIADLLLLSGALPGSVSERAGHELRRLHALTAQAISAEPAGAGYAAPMSELEIAEQFDFLGGLIDDYTFNMVMGAAKRIHGNALRASHGQAPAQPEVTPAFCPCCNGSGDNIVMDGAGPYAQEITTNCQHCKGSGLLVDAYQGIVGLLWKKEREYLDCCAKLYVRPTPSPQAADTGAAQGAGITAVGGVPSEFLRRFSRNTIAPTLRAMSKNYSEDHSWDALDARACEQGAAEIDQLFSMLAAAPQPAPPADSQQAPVLWVSPEQLAGFADKDLEPFGTYIPARKTSAGKFTMPLFAARATADSVLEDAARYQWLRQHWFTMSSNYKGCITFRIGEPRWSDITEEALDAAIDSARKQGGSHD